MKQALRVKGSLRGSGRSGPVLWDHLEGWGGEGGGWGFGMGDTCAPVADPR